MAYLVTQYPAISHAFIEREIFALRDLGYSVQTFTVRRASADDLLNERMRQEFASTFALVGQPMATYVRAALWLFRRCPNALLQGALLCWRSGALRVRNKVWQHFYLIEALVLLQQLKARDIRHVHVHHANNAADVARLVVRMGNALDGSNSWRWTLSMHGSREFFDTVGHDLAAKVRSAQTIAAISHYCKELLLAPVGGQYSEKTHIVRMGVDTRYYTPPSDFRKSRPIGKLRILYVGRLVDGKGLEDLLSATRDFSSRGYDVHLEIVGSGPIQEKLKETTQNLGVEERVTWLGPKSQEELPSIYAEADVFCLPSYAEGVPVVLMEAMATGLPVVSTKIAGIPELVEDGQSGYLIEPGDVQNMVDIFARLADAVDLRREIGVNARKRVAQEFQPAHNAELLAKALNLKHPPRSGLSRLVNPQSEESQVAKSGPAVIPRLPAGSTRDLAE